MNWIIISEEYLSYLRTVEPRIPRSDYGKDKFKPFFGTLFEIDDLCYVTQVSSPKERHYKLRESLDFYKLYNPKSKRLLSVVNLNYMFPVPKGLFEDLNYGDISHYRSFRSSQEESRYIQLLRLELRLIRDKNIDNNAIRLYELKKLYPQNNISKRCIDFREIEILAYKYTTETAKR